MKSPSACQNLVFRLTDYLEGLCSEREGRQIERHLKDCCACRALMADVQGLSGLVCKADAPAALLAPLAEQALAGALARLSAPHSVRHFSALPEAVKLAMAGPMDLPLRLMSEVHERFLRGELPSEAPFLPPSVLAQLPAPQTWKWTNRNGIRRALLAKDPVTGQRLSLMYAPPQSQVPAHRHLGSESLLVLHGDMEDGDRCLSDGAWTHLERGSTHAPCMMSGGCWCLVRDEGSIRYTALNPSA